MSMREVIESIEHDAFSKCMNPPVESNEAYIQYDYKTKQNWVHCPYCGKKQFPIGEDTFIENLIQKCKASGCKKEFVVTVRPQNV